MINLLDTVIQGVLLGGVYALFATGLSLSFGIMRFVNIAHGDFIIASAYVALSVIGFYPMVPLATLIFIIPLLAIIGYWAQKVVYNRLMGRDIMPSLLVTFGISIILQNLMLEFFSGDSRRLDGGELVNASIQIGEDLSIGLFPLIVFFGAIALLGALQLFFAKTNTGRILRATSDDKEIVELMGVNSKKMYAIAMAIASATVAIAGVDLGMSKAFDPLLGPSLLIYAFEAVIIGGLGSLWGTLAGGMVLGLSQTIGFRIDPGWGLIFGHVAFFAVLLLRPQGIFPATRDH